MLEYKTQLILKLSTPSKVKALEKCKAIVRQNCKQTPTLQCIMFKHLTRSLDTISGTQTQGLKMDDAMDAEGFGGKYDPSTEAGGYHGTFLDVNKTGKQNDMFAVIRLEVRSKRRN